MDGALPLAVVGQLVAVARMVGKDLDLLRLGADGELGFLGDVDLGKNVRVELAGADPAAAEAER